MAKDFISDEEMGQLEKKGHAKAVQEQYHAPEFLSDDEMEKLAPKKPVEKEGAGKAFLEHYGNTALLGHLPHLQALAEKLMPNPNADLDEKLKGEGFKIEEKSPTYIDSRDTNIKRLAQEKEDFPKSALAGDVAGMAGGALVTGGLAGGAPAASAAGRIAQGAKIGAGMGALANPGDTEGELSADLGLQLKDRAKGAALGAALGAGASGAVEGASALGSKAIDALRTRANSNAFSALGRPTPTQLAKLKAEGLDQKIGRDLLDEGAIPVLGTPGRIAKRVENLKSEAGQEIGDLLAKGGDEKLMDSTELALQLLDDPSIARMRKTPGMEGAADKIEKQIETLASNGKLSLKEAQKLRQDIDASINFNKRVPEMGAAQDGLYKQRSAISDKMNDLVNGLGDGEIPADALRKANQRYSGMSRAEEILDRQMARDQANRSISLTDTIAGAGGVAAGSPLLGVALGAANKFGRTFGDSIAARSQNGLASLLQKSPRFAEMAKSNPQAFQMLVQQMGNKVQGAPSFNAPSEDPLFKNPQLMERLKRNPELIDSIQDEKLKAQLKEKFVRNPATESKISDQEAKDRFIQGN